MPHWTLILGELMHSYNLAVAHDNIVIVCRYRVNVTAGGIMRSEIFRTCGIGKDVFYVQSAVYVL